jgi:hypothetical protein
MAQRIMNDSLASHVFDLCLDLLVPSFALYEFESLRPHFDPLADNFCYFSSLAGTTFFNDFGYHFPATIWIHLHNLMATLSARCSYDELAPRFLTTTVTEAVAATGNVALTPAHYFAATITATTNPTSRRAPNWFNRIIDDFLAPNTIRVINAQATISRLPVDNPATADIVNYNAYTYLTGYTQDNAQEMLRLLRALNDFTKHTYPQSKPLRNYITTGTDEIARHLSFDSVLPTWHTQTAPSLADIYTPNGPNNLFGPSPPAGSSMTSTQFASAIQYLVPRPQPSTDPATTPPSIVTVSGVLPDPNPTNGVLLELTEENPPTLPDVNTYVRQFNSIRHTLPPCLIFDPVSSATSHLASVLTAGKIIVTNDVSGIAITIPSVLTPLNTVNAHFIQGAIPRSHTRNNLTGTPFIVRRRNWETQHRPAQAYFRSLLDRIVIPTFRIGTILPVASTHRPTQVTQLFPGTVATRHVNNALDGINVFSNPLGAPWSNFPENTVPVWSSYRYYDRESKQWYILPTLRHIYGVRSRYFGSLHPALRIN